METKTPAAEALVMHTVGDAASLAGISKRYMEIRIEQGTGPDVTRIGRRVLIRDDRLRRWIDEQTEAAMPANADSAVIAAEHKAMVKCLMQHDHAGMARVVNSSRYPHKLHLAAALAVIARMVAESPDPEKLLDAIGEIVARD